MIKFLPSILGNKNIQNFVAQAAKSKLSHAYLVIAEDEMSLTEIVNSMAAIIFCDSHTACGACLACRKTMHGNHANLHYFTATAQDIKVATVQEIIADMTLTATENAPSVYIIDGADRMNESAQNKLLKTLEDPKDNCIIILGATNENSLLPTVKSRCKQLYVNIWDKNSIATELAAVAKNMNQSDPQALGARLEFATDMSEGSIKRGVELLSDESYYSRFSALKDMLTNLNSSQQVSSYLGILGANWQEAETSLSILETLFNRALHAIVNNESDDISRKFTLAAIVNIQELIIEQHKKLKSYCAISSVEDSLLMGILEIRYKTK